ncbi:MAG: SAM-dependent methyltransferase [Bacteroidetes bacterium]|nr:SAM-dependent methyltransferase [Bacteroidota bacterium]
MNISTDKLQKFILSFETSWLENNFIKITLGNYQGNEPNLKQIIIKKVMIKKQGSLSFTLRYKTNDITKNFTYEDGLIHLRGYLTDGFLTCNLFTTSSDLQLEVLKNGKTVFREKAASHHSIQENHDRQKQRHIVTEGKNYLHDLDITAKDGSVLKHGQDKYRQINHYIELLAPMLKQLPREGKLQISDMGSGKGYLTFALYDYLTDSLELEVDITGVEYREDLVQKCNQIALKNSFTNLHFVQSDIASFNNSNTDVLIALHACDTATDDAMYKGIEAGSKLIVVAPCCHKEVRKAIVSSKKQNELDFIIRHGILLERQAEMITDSMRALILEYFGYKVKVFEFISDVHTPKNILIVGELHEINPISQTKIHEKLKARMEFFGILQQKLQQLAGL